MIFGKLKLILLGIGGFLAALLAAYMRGQQDRADKIIEKQLETYKDTRGRIDEVNDVKRDANASREWLRNRNK